MKKIFVFYNNQPVLDYYIEQKEGVNKGNKYGLNRDRNPDRDWTQLRNSLMNENCKEVELTNELKIILLEDLAFAFGNNTSKFNQKLREFGLIENN